MILNAAGDEENLISSMENQNIDDAYMKTVRNVYVYKTNGEIIWGITARLIYELVKLLKTK